MSAEDFTLSHASELKLPLLIIHGSEDHICSPDGSREFASKSAMTDLKIWDNGYHELHNELFKEDVLSCIVSWINKHLT
jgi:alpha-beta hydrolase superfamily lysophospholipase